MANVFLEKDHSEIETAILLEQAYQTDIDKAVAYTDGNRVFINTDDNLSKILPDYNKGMLKWLLWHEKYHNLLRHHNRFFRYLKELDEQKTMDEFQVTKEEVNIIMDILVHDSLCKLFPELVETAVNNLAQMRNRNSLGYTFTTFTLEDMLDEYAKYKHKDKIDGSKGEGEGDGEGEDEGEGDKKSKDKKTRKEDEGSGTDDSKKGHGEGGHEDGETPKKKEDDKEPEITDKPKDEHDLTDWSKLKDRDSKEFITEGESDRYVRDIERLRRKKIKLGRLTQTLNGLATTTKTRTYRLPSYIQAGQGIVLKGKLPAKTTLYLCFDASGSMAYELDTFKEIITKAIPQAMECPCEWFSGYGQKIPAYKGCYYKGKFKDIIPVKADCGYDDDGDRTIELCWQAEQKGYSPIGVTDGGGQISWSKDKLKQLKRTVLVGQNKNWLEKAKSINPSIQILDIDD